MTSQTASIAEARRESETDVVGFFRRPLLVLLFLLLAGLFVRLHSISEAPRDFWTIRQYYNALSARSLYFENNPDIPEWRKDALGSHKVWLAEPPIMEFIVSRVYRLLKAEHFWVFRSITVSAWLIGAVFLYLLARRMFNPDAALVTASYYLFLPFGVTASRSWQPDSLMIAGVVASAYFMYRYFEDPTRKRLIAAGLVAALATVFKPGGSVLTLVGIFGFMMMAREGFWRTLVHRRCWAFAALMLIPPALIVWLSAMMGWYQPGTHFSTYLAPRLLSTFFFWKGWIGILVRVLTLPGLMIAAIGALLVFERKPRSLVFGYAAGYVAFSLICSFTTANHDYWHLQVIPLAALCLGSVSVPIWRVLATRAAPWIAKPVVLGIGILWPVLGLEQAPWLEDRGSNSAEYSMMAREIGKAVRHSTRVITLDYDFSNPLRYYAEIDGPIWPQSEAMQYDRQTGKDRASDGTPQWNTLGLPAQERFELFYAERNPEFFVICRLLGELDLQPGLREFLSQYPVHAKGHRYIIYDLRRGAE